MKSSLESTDDSLSTTSEFNKIQIKENNYFYHIDKLAIDHDVTATNTMIKITYKKALKDQNSSDDFIVEPSTQSNFPEKDNSDILFLSNSTKGSVFHSTPKPIETEKKKKYLNGLNLATKRNNQEDEKNCRNQTVEKPSEDDGGGKSDNIPNSDKKLFVKLNSSINHKGGGEKKKTKGSVKKLENGVTKRTGMDKKSDKVGEIKRKASNTELNASPKYKKIKVSDSKELNENVKEENKTFGKRPIMLVDPELPAGWSRFIRTKNKGSTKEQHIVYVVNPQGKKFRFKWKLRQYLQKTNSILNADQFFFGLYERPKPSSSFNKYQNGSECSKDNDSEHEHEDEKQDESSNDAKSSDGKELLLTDPNLPFGWKRIIHSNSTNGKKQVHIISPDGKIFRRRYLLNEYLLKHQFIHDLDSFYFGLYPKKEKKSETLGKEREEKTLSSVKLIKPENPSKAAVSATSLKKAKTEVGSKDTKGDLISPSAMSEDPKLPEGWKRLIKIRSLGESAGKMDVVIVSPDGRRHHSKKHLEHYLLQKQLNYNVNDFDFTGFEKSKSKKNSPEPELEPEPLSFSPMKKKFTDKPVPELDISSLKDEVITREGQMINTVNGLMMCSGLSSVRNEKRQRILKEEHEKQLKTFFSKEGYCTDGTFNGCEIPTVWVERLVKCRAEFRSLESDAASTIAKSTKEFIKTLSLHALTNSPKAEAGLKYEDLAEVVDRTECLSFLKMLIPKKITFREYLKLNRPTKFLSFT